MTKADKRRFTAFQRIGCVACHKQGWFREADVHHLLSGGRRKGHRHTIPLCPWHHRGTPYGVWTVKDTEHEFGPSLARTPRKFRERYGTDDELLALVDRLIGEAA